VGKGEVKKSAVHGKTKPIKLQPYKVTFVQLFLPGLSARSRHYRRSQKSLHNGLIDH